MGRGSGFESFFKILCMFNTFQNTTLDFHHYNFTTVTSLMVPNLQARQSGLQTASGVKGAQVAGTPCALAN